VIISEYRRADAENPRRKNGMRSVQSIIGATDKVRSSPHIWLARSTLNCSGFRSNHCCNIPAHPVAFFVCGGDIKGTSSTHEACPSIRLPNCRSSEAAILPTIKVRKQVNGITRYTAVVRRRQGKTLIHQESRTFAHRTRR